MVHLRGHLRSVINRIEIRNQGHCQPVVACDSFVAGDHHARLTWMATAQLGGRLRANPRKIDCLVACWIQRTREAVRIFHEQSSLRAGLAAYPCREGHAHQKQANCAGSLHGFRNLPRLIRFISLPIGHSKEPQFRKFRPGICRKRPRHALYIRRPNALTWARYEISTVAPSFLVFLFSPPPSSLQPALQFPPRRRRPIRLPLKPRRTR